MDTLRKLGDIQFTKELWIFIIPGALMLIDFFSGLLNAWVKHEIKSSKMREGLAKKCGESLVLVIGELFTIAIEMPPYFIVALSAYIIIMELISICENLDKLGVPIPNWVKKALKNAEEKIQNDPKNEDKEDEDGTR